MNVYPALRYHDARAAIDWLCEAFGFSEKQVHPGEDGAIAHAELRVPGGGVVMLSSEPEGGDPRWGAHAGQGWIYIAIENPDALHDRAAAAGAEIVMELTGHRLRLARLLRPRPRGQPLELRDLRALTRPRGRGRAATPRASPVSSCRRGASPSAR